MSGENTTWHDISNDEGPELWPDYIPAPYTWRELEVLEAQWREQAEKRRKLDEERKERLLHWEWQQEHLRLSAIERANDAMVADLDREIEESRRQEEEVRVPHPNPLALWFWGSFFFDLGEMDLFPDEYQECNSV